ncbi:UDP-N-acetylmuramate:L-alanyl-gamma-D-glutamyl-meso-diaminopimelate ligase [Pseudomarimonas arenosa]|uniref:UDP-N-acetylmuramate--L-alanyl-gamma-D-glutamyl-meso-2,6-diaminoheptandioate ligase n=1 Tax=Pseudomarimonas arenosa TaxID=2774145 RepID=A0AAW3ZHV1_9GAMM|nr:UDP-N-acetylmuramate:L-alanyl-gamma-D-glutamyl-meso-diaminopimelate ligase [Pseudomarimonas arenosa]MBD8525109.1 UDP-N-acetylmuramate:L-alanyl-gamma-D-glutamyl-meso-diaminopimelate ligase [Pseudomarimonas arenosa]
MKLHVMGICGTFMGGIAALAREAGHEVEGTDQNVYPPMSDQLNSIGIRLRVGYQPQFISDECQQVVIGNALSRGNPAIEAVLNSGRDYVSGPQWLRDNVLVGRQVLAVAGTHGKTTTSSLLAWILEHAGKAPGFLIGGVPGNFPVSARTGDGECFVVEADEYDTAFFDKRSKFVHYRPRVVVLNNLEYDHADIFPDLTSIKQQFHHLIRCVPGNGRLIVNAEDFELDDVLSYGSWTPIERFAIDDSLQVEWGGRLLDPSGSRFAVRYQGLAEIEVSWSLLGRHNVMNALAAIAAAHAAGVTVHAAADALAGFKPPKRRLERLLDRNGIRVYDDFAHHPTAIRTTLEGLRASHPKARLIAVLEPRSNSMRLGAHAAALPESLAPADLSFMLRRPELPWNAEACISKLGGKGKALPDVDTLVRELHGELRSGDVVVLMSNGSFDGASRRLVELLTKS